MIRAAHNSHRKAPEGSPAGPAPSRDMVEQIGAILHPLVNRARLIVRDLDRHVLHSAHEIGGLVHEHGDTIRAAQSLGSAARIDVYEYLAHEINRTSRVLRQYEQFHCEFDEELLSRVVNADLSWTHIRTLLSVIGEQRTRYLELTIKNRWSAQELSAEVTRKLGNRRPGAGRRATVPRGLSAGMKKTLNAVGQFRKALNIVLGDEFDLAAAVIDEPPDEITEATALQVRETITGFELIAKALGENLPRLRQAAEHIDRQLQTRASDRQRKD